MVGLGYKLQATSPRYPSSKFAYYKLVYHSSHVLNTCQNAFVPLRHWN